MQKYFSYLIAIVFLGTVVSLSSCTKDEDPPADAGESTTELLVKKFSAAPALDGDIEEMWGTAQRLVGTTEVPSLAARGTYLNGDGEGFEESIGLFAPYSGEKYDFTMRAGYTAENIYFLLEWKDDEDSKDRQSWYFDPSDKLWKGEHKYANDAGDKFYEDKFSFLFPIGEVSNFSSATCYATCHQNLVIENPKDKHTRHYLTVEGEKIDMWHWKRVRGTYQGQIDDQKMVYAEATGSAANGRKGDATGQGGYSNNSQTLNNGNADVSVPKYVIPNKTEYYWISMDDIDDGTAKLITAVDAEGVLTYEGGSINPADGGYEHATGNKRLPSVTTRPFTEGRGDISITAVYTGTGWVCEFTRKLNTNDEDDVVFEISKELPFGLAIFNNAAIAHAIKPNLMLKFEQ
mgnify:CR=1 FL=1